MDFLGSKERKPLAQVEAHLVSEYAFSTNTGTVMLDCAGVDDFFQ